MYELYIPENLQNYSCFFYNDNGTILYATNSTPIENQPIQVEKIFVNNHYSIIHDTLLPTKNYNCLDNQKTTNWFYRKDSLDIALLVIIFSIFFFVIPIYLLSRLFKRGVR